MSDVVSNTAAEAYKRFEWICQEILDQLQIAKHRGRFPTSQIEILLPDLNAASRAVGLTEVPITILRGKRFVFVPGGRDFTTLTLWRPLHEVSIEESHTIEIVDHPKLSGPGKVPVKRDLSSVEHIDLAISTIQSCLRWLQSDQRSSVHGRDGDPGGPPKTAGTPKTREKSSGLTPEAWKELVLSVLVEHHEHESGSVNDAQPIKQKDLVAKLGLDPKAAPRVCEAFNSLFGHTQETTGHKKYVILCRNGTKLADKLAALRGETPLATGASDQIDGITSSDEPLVDAILDRNS